MNPASTAFTTMISPHFHPPLPVDQLDNDTSPCMKAGKTRTLTLTLNMHSHAQAQLKACIHSIPISESGSTLCQINAERNDYRFTVSSMFLSQKEMSILVLCSS